MSRTREPLWRLSLVFTIMAWAAGCSGDGGERQDTVADVVGHEAVETDTVPPPKPKVDIVVVDRSLENMSRAVHLLWFGRAAKADFSGLDVQVFVLPARNFEVQEPLWTWGIMDEGSVTPIWIAGLEAYYCMLFGCDEMMKNGVFAVRCYKECTSDNDCDGSFGGFEPEIAGVLEKSCVARYGDWPTFCGLQGSESVCSSSVGPWVPERSLKDLWCRYRSVDPDVPCCMEQLANSWTKTLHFLGLLSGGTATWGSLRADADLVLVFIQDLDDGSVDPRYQDPLLTCKQDTDCPNDMPCLPDVPMSAALGEDTLTCAGVVRRFTGTDAWVLPSLLGDYVDEERRALLLDPNSLECTDDAECEEDWHCTPEGKCRPRYFSFFKVASFLAPDGVPLGALLTVPAFTERVRTIVGPSKRIMVATLAGGVECNEEGVRYVTSDACKSDPELTACAPVQVQVGTSPLCSPGFSEECVRQCYFASMGERVGDSEGCADAVVCHAELEGPVKLCRRTQRLAASFGLDGWYEPLCGSAKTVEGRIGNMVRWIRARAEASTRGRQ